VTIIPIATDTLAEPNTVPTTVGMVAKNPPFAAPLMMTKLMSGPREFETGQITSILAALNNKDMNNALSGPSLSAAKPQILQPKRS
jgi:hypothetical protein